LAGHGRLVIVNIQLTVTLVAQWSYLSSLFQRRERDIPDMTVPSVQLGSHDDQNCGSDGEDLAGVNVAPRCLREGYVPWQES
jgi:hypothetical protein